MAGNRFKLMILAVLYVSPVTANDNDDSPLGSSFDSSSFDSSNSDSVSALADASSPSEESSPPASASELLSSIGPLLSLLQPLLGGILSGTTIDGDPGVTYPPLLRPLFQPLPLLPGLGIIPSSLAAQASDLIASAAASARSRFAHSARESAARSQMNYGAILDAINELNQPLDGESL